MAKIVIGNVKGKDGRGITKIVKTASTGAVDTYTITYTDSTTSTFTINNSDSISLQRQIVPSAAVESSATASQAYKAGDYVVVNGALRRVKAAIAKGNTIGDSNSATTTVSGELGSLASTVGETDIWHTLYETSTLGSYYTKRHGVLYVRVHATCPSAGWVKVGTLPDGYRPKMSAYAPMYNFDANDCAGILIGTDGGVSVRTYQATGTNVWGIVSIPLW